MVISFFPTVVSLHAWYLGKRRGNKRRKEKCGTKVFRHLGVCRRKFSKLVSDGGESDEEEEREGDGISREQGIKVTVMPTVEPNPSASKVVPGTTITNTKERNDGRGATPPAPGSVSHESRGSSPNEIRSEVEMGGKSESAMPPADHAVKLGAIETFFKRSYYPFVRKHKILLLFLNAVLLAFMISRAVMLQPDAEDPALFKPGTNLEEYRPALVDYFARGASQNSIPMQLAFGIDPTDPLDRSGTSITNATDYGTVHFDSQLDLARGFPCLLEICATLEEKNENLEIGGAPDYPVECWAKALSDYVDENPSLYSSGYLDTITGFNANSTAFDSVLNDWLSISDVYAQWRGLIRSERVNGVVTVRLTLITWKLMADFQMDYTKGIELGRRWEQWYADTMAAGVCGAVNTSLPGFVESAAFHYYRVSETMIAEAFTGIAISLSVAFVVLTIATSNIIVGLLSTLCIAAIVTCVLGFTVLQGWKLGILESINFVMVPGLSVDYVAHFAEAYVRSAHATRAGRVKDMMTEVGVSVLSGAISTLGATFFLFFPEITFFAKFGTFIFVTILFSLVASMTLFPSLLLTPLGPQGRRGDLKVLFKRDTYPCCRKKR
mmetsp:Transcript_35647/g.92927  ORF Transcript_35647/g.92927 Transcript_35647/m.92927 type:complete len:609 (-) Transcript_35647:346-2172(-)